MIREERGKVSQNYPGKSCIIQKVIVHLHKETQVFRHVHNIAVMYLPLRICYKPNCISTQSIC